MISLNDLYLHTSPEAINAVLQGDERIASGAISNAYAYVKAQVRKCSNITDIDSDETLRLAVIKRALYELFIYSNDVVVAEQFKNDANSLIKARIGDCTVENAGASVVYVKEGEDNWNGFK